MTDAPWGPSLSIRWESNPADSHGFKVPIVTKKTITLQPAWAREPSNGYHVTPKPPNPPGTNLSPRRKNSRLIRRRIVRDVYKADPDDATLLLPCYFCHDQRPWQALTSEHMIPLALGGTNRSRNLRLSCYDCNQARDRHMRQCDACQQPGGVCLRGLVYALPPRTCSRNRLCPLAAVHTWTLRNQLRFTLRGMIRSGRAALYVNVRAGHRTWTLPSNWNELANGRWD